MFDFATYTLKDFSMDDLMQKKEIVAALGQNFILKNKKLTFKHNGWFIPFKAT